ncbi:motility-associated protein, partial [Acinetobacter baumannii]
MLIIVGFLVVIISVIGGYLGAHGRLGALWQPYELVIIGGAALGAFLV